MERGISEPEILRAIVSTTNKNNAPMPVDKGNTYRLLAPVIRRQICGTTNPTQPIVPHKQTLPAVARVAQMIAMPFKRPTETPTEAAFSSPIDSKSIRQRKQIRTTSEIKIGASKGRTSVILIDAKEPNVQYTIEASSLSGSAKYFANPISACMKPDIITPERTSIKFELFIKIRGIQVASATVSKPTAKAASCTPNEDQCSKIATAAPTQAPADTPN